MNEKALIERLEAVRQKAHAPYSQFKVGALIIDNNDNIHVGCNVENAAYPSGCCAEQSAVSQMVVNGGTQIKRIYIKGGSETHCPPCGQCRQIIAEFSQTNTQIVMLDAKNNSISCQLNELLPAKFDTAHLRSGKSLK